MTLTVSEREELEFLRQCNHKFMTCPKDKAFAALESILNNNHPNRFDTIMPSSAFNVLARALIELKRSLEGE